MRKYKMNWPEPKNSGPNLRSFLFLVWGTLGPCQVGPLLDEILATCLICFKVDPRSLSAARFIGITDPCLCFVMTSRGIIYPWTNFVMCSQIIHQCKNSWWVEQDHRSDTSIIAHDCRYLVIE